MSTSWLWLNIFQSRSSLLRCRTSHHTTPVRLSYNRSQVGLGLVLSALLIKDQNSEENSKTYLIMFSLTIIGFQGIIPKLMALEKKWFRHARRNFRRFVSFGTKRIGTWLYFTSPWVIGCPNTFLCFICLLTFYFLRNIHSTFFHCCSNGLGCGLRFLSHLG
jgi:hypothetical protein